LLELSSKIGSGVTFEVPGSCQSSSTVPVLLPALQSHASHRNRRQGSEKAVKQQDRDRAENRSVVNPRRSLYNNFRGRAFWGGACRNRACEASLLQTLADCCPGGDFSGMERQAVFLREFETCLVVTCNELSLSESHQSLRGKEVFTQQAIGLKKSNMFVRGIVHCTQSAWTCWEHRPMHCSLERLGCSGCRR
jgi:hypothetical protein